MAAMTAEQWDSSWMLEAYEEARMSPDPSTQNGAVIVGYQHGTMLGQACNTYPPGVLSHPARLIRPVKYHYIEHAERGAIFSAAIDGLSAYRSTMYALWGACSDCARAIIASGITELVTHSFYDDYEGPWSRSIEVGDKMFEEAGVVRRRVDSQIMNRGEYILFNREEVRF